MSPQAERKMPTLAAFVRLSRPKFLIGGFAGFGLGAAVAAYEGSRVSPWLYFAGQAMVTAFHLMTHYANDYFDRHADRLTVQTAFAGGSGVLVSGALAAPVALVAALGCAAAGGIAVAGFALAGNGVVAGLGVAIGILAWCYSAPPIRLAGRGWGEIDTALVVAVLVPLSGYATVRGTLDPLVLAATAAPACAMIAMMLAVEWPDRAADSAAGKRNLVVRFGARVSGRLAAVSTAVIVPAMSAATAYGAPRSLIPFALALVPLLAGFVGRVLAPRSRADDIAAHGVSVFLLTVIFSTLAFLAVLR